MDCRETQTLLTAFHDGELPAVDRARVEEHLRGCPECVTLLADLALADQAAGVPDPGPAYWDRFNARVMERVEREADGPKVTVLRPKHGWIRQQYRYLVPAAAAAALVVMVVRYGGMHPGAPIPTVPPTASERAAPEPAGVRTTKVEPEPQATKKAEGAAVARPAPPPLLEKDRFSTVTREEQDRLAAPSPAGRKRGGVAESHNRPCRHRCAVAVTAEDVSGRARRFAAGRRRSRYAPGDASQAGENGGSGRQDDGTASRRQGEFGFRDEDREGVACRLTLRACARACRTGTVPGSGRRPTCLSRRGP